MMQTFLIILKRLIATIKLNLREQIVYPYSWLPNCRDVTAIYLLKICTPLRSY